MPAFFWLGQYTKGFWACFFEPYAGYLHVIPRIISAVADWFPYSWAPVVYVWSAAVVTGWTAATIASLVLPYAMSVMLGVSIVLVAHGGEVWATATNLQWITATALPLIAITQTPSSLVARANQFTFVAMASLSGPFSLIAAPLWIYRLWRTPRHRRFDLALCELALLSAGCTLIVILLHPGASPDSSQFFALTAVSLERSCEPAVEELVARAGFGPKLAPFSNLLMARDFLSKRVMRQHVKRVDRFSAVLPSALESAPVLETVWKRSSTLPSGAR